MGEGARGREASAYDPALWRELGELGWPGIAVGEEHGEQGLGAVELSVLLEELGYGDDAELVSCADGGAAGRHRLHGGVATRHLVGGPVALSVLGPR